MAAAAGGECGQCAEGVFCDAAGQCPAEGKGESCAAPFVVGALPFTGSGDTIGQSNSYSYDAGDCPGDNGGRGAGSADNAWQFTAPKGGAFLFELDPAFDATISVVRDCDDPALADAHRRARFPRQPDRT